MRKAIPASKIDPDLYKVSGNHVILMMRDFYRFEGRGFGSEPHETNYMIESEEGTVLVVSLKIGNAEFILAYCRKAIADRWGVYCDNPFRRASDPGCTRSWAQHFQGGIFIFRGVRFHLIREEEWMLRTP